MIEPLVVATPCACHTVKRDRCMAVTDHPALLVYNEPNDKESIEEERRAEPLYNSFTILSLAMSRSNVM